MFRLDRRREPEIMDQPGLDAASHAAALRGLGRINVLSACAGMLWRPLRALAKTVKPLRVLDVATGGGDVPIRIARRAGGALELSGCDKSATAIAFAQCQAERAGVGVRFFRLDVLKDPIPDGYDVITCSLFLHHLDEDDAVLLLGKMGAASRYVLVNDLARSRRGLVLAHAATRLLSRSSVVHTDGPRSVVAAYTPAEALALAERAGLNGATVVRRWPCRFLLTWSRPA